MATNPTVFDLFRSKAVSLDDIATAADTVAAGFLVDDYPLTGGWRLSLKKAVLADERAAEAVRTSQEIWKRNMVRTAILLAHPVKA